MDDFWHHDLAFYCTYFKTITEVPLPLGHTSFVFGTNRKSSKDSVGAPDNLESHKSEDYAKSTGFPKDFV